MPIEEMPIEEMPIEEMPIEVMPIEGIPIEGMPIEGMQKNTDLQTIEIAEEEVIETDVVADTMLQDEEQVPGHSRGKRIAALTGVILLIVMVLATLVVACLDFNGSHQLFMVLVFCDISVPVFLWFILHFLH